MIFEIPTTSTPRYTQRTRLDGVDFVLLFDWNGRAQRWYLSVYDANENPIALGIKLVHGWGLLRGVTAADRPPGQLFCLDMSGAGEDPGLADLGTRCRLYYFDTSEVRARK